MFEQTSTANTQQTKITNGKSRRGFASMDKDRHKLVSGKGGKAPRRPISSIRDIQQASPSEGVNR